MIGANSIWYQLGLDNSQLQRDVSRASNLIHGVGDTVNSEGTRIDNMVKRLTSGVAAFGASFSAGALIKQIASVRGEFQQLETALETILGSKRRADTLMSQLVNTAAKTPFDLTGVANGAKQLLAYGTAAEDVNDTLIRLGNIASGLSIPLNDLVYLYGTTQVQGRLFTQDVRQFMGRGIPLVQQLAKELGKTEEQINEMVTAGKIGFPEVQKVIQNLTNEGGMFFNLMEKQSASITGQIANLEDAWDMMLNDIGSKSEGVFSGAIGVATSLIENYEKAGKILLGVTAVYGAYKGAVIALSIVENLRYQAALAQMAGMTKMQAIMDVLRAKTAALNATMLANPYVLVTMTIVALGYAVWALHDATTTQEKAQERLNQITEEARQKKEDLEGQTSKLTGVINSETKTIFDQISAYKELQGLYPGLLKNMDLQTFKSMSATEQQKLLNQAINEASKADLEDRIKNQESIIKNLEKEIQLTSESMSYQREGSTYHAYRLGQLDDQKKAEEIVLETLREQQAEQEAMRKEAELLALPEDKRREILQNQLTELEKQKSIIESQITSVGSVLGEWQKFNPLFFKLNGQLGEILNKINETKNKLTANPTIQNKSYWEKQKKDATEALEAMAPSDKNSEAWKKQVALIKEANKNLKAWDFSGKDTESAAERVRKQAEALKKAKEKQSLQEIRAAEDLNMQINEAELNSMSEGSQKVLAQMKLDYEKQKLALKRQQEDVLQTKKDNARSVFEADPKNKGKVFDDIAIKLTETELKNYQDLQIKQTENFEKNKFDLELQYMRDYIKEYGTFQQKKFEIAQEYDKKIAASGNEYDRKSLESQKKVAIKNVDFEAINKRIDWQGVFGNLTGMLESEIKETLTGLKEYVKTDQFNTISDTDKKTVYDAIENLRKVMLGGEGTLDFNVIRQQMNGLAVAIERVQSAALAEKVAYDTLVKSQKKYDEALKTGNQSIIEGAKQNLDIAKLSATEASNAYKEAEANVQNIGNSYREIATDTVDGLNLVAEGFNNLASNSLPQLFRGLQNTVSGLSKLNIGGKVGEAVSSLSKTISSVGFIGQIISAALSILDVLKDGVGSLVANLVDTVLNAVDGILKDVLSGGIVLKVANSLKNGIKNILNTISFGGFNSFINSISGGNAKETAETISRLTTSNEALKVSIDALKDEITRSNGSKSIQAYSEAVEAQRRYNENLRNILGAQMDYSKSHHSNAYYWNLNPNSLKQVNSLLGTNLRNKWGDFSKLTADQMNEIRKHLPDVWTEMIKQGKYGDRFKDDWNNYADQAGKIEELTNSLRENIAQISFNSLRDSFVNALMDMDSDAQTFADNFEEYLTKALLNFAVGDLLDERIKEWYNSWTDAINKSDGKLTDKQIDKFRDEWNDIVQAGINQRDEIVSMTGYKGKNGSHTQSSSRGSFEAMTQEQAGELNGRFTALQISGANIERYTLSISTDVHEIYDLQVNIKNAVTSLKISFDEIRNIQLQSMYYLEDIVKYTKVLPEMADDIKGIKKNTAKL